MTIALFEDETLPPARCDDCGHGWHGLSCVYPDTTQNILMREDGEPRPDACGCPSQFREEMAA